MMHTQTDLIEALATNRDTLTATIDGQIEDLERRRQASNENFEIMRKNADGEFENMINLLRELRAMVKPEYETMTEKELLDGLDRLVSQPEESPEQKAARIVGLEKRAA